MDSLAKSIVLFSDGTGNSSAKLFKTNVWRLYEAVDLGPAQPAKQKQIAFYDDGVGTSSFRPLALLGGVFGMGLKRNVLEIYSYVCRNYDPDSRPLPKRSSRPSPTRPPSPSSASRSASAARVASSVGASSSAAR